MPYYGPSRIFHDSVSTYIEICDRANVPIDKARIDDADVELVRAFRWHRYWDARSYRARANRPSWFDWPTAQIQLPRLLLRPPSSMEVDHINGHTLDCRRINLRVVDHYANQQNRGVRRGNSTGARNVRFDKRNKCFAVELRANGERFWGGYYHTREEAIEAARCLRAATGINVNEERTVLPA